MTALPTKIDLIEGKIIPPTYDQGELGSSVSCAASWCLEYQMLNDIGKASQFLYYYERLYDDTVPSQATQRGDSNNP